MNISYDNYRTSSYENENEDNVDTDDSNKDFDRFVVSATYSYMHVCICNLYFIDYLMLVNGKLY